MLRAARAPSSPLPILAMRLLLSSSILSRCSRGNPSSLPMALSDRSMLSNWFCREPKTHTKVSECHVAPWGLRTAGLMTPARVVGAALTSVAPRFSMAPILLPAEICSTLSDQVRRNEACRAHRGAHRAPLKSSSYSLMALMYWGLRRMSSAVRRPASRGPNAPAPALVSAIARAIKCTRRHRKRSTVALHLALVAGAVLGKEQNGQLLGVEGGAKCRHGN